MNVLIRACLYAGFGISLGISTSAHAIVIAQNTNTGDLADALLDFGGGGIDRTSVTSTLSGHTRGEAASSGTYTNASGTYGIGPGIVLSTGNVSNYADGPNNFTDCATNFANGTAACTAPSPGTAGVAATAAQEALLDPITGSSYDHYDVTQLDIMFDMETGFDQVFFNVTFGSDEFPEFVGTSVIDGFGLYLNGTNIAFVDGDPININHPDIIAFSGTELDGILGGSTGSFGAVAHTFSGSVLPTGNILTLIIADTSDGAVDSTVYVSQLGGTLPRPIPEPGTVLLMGLGLAGIGYRRRQLKKA